ncbi:hypothetical protein [Brachyspira sp.]|uniref:hypothetical protein n=1 Tax=Brachyspira sp. TaxID=1977261 RepID=UPI002629FEA4|nr:hypothetical protein [Brachyspira sp.]
MNKKLYLIFIVIISLIFISCGGHFFNPRYYYNKNTLDSGESGGGDIDLGGENLLPEDDPFSPFYKGEGYYGWNDENYIFNGSIIDKWFMKVNFGRGNVPDYKFFMPQDGRTWVQKDSLKNEFSFDASSDGNKVTHPITVSISGMIVYKYVNKNPLIDAKGSYNASDRLKRFIFIRIDGSAAGTPMDNYLIAIDKYSKFIFAYAKITKTGSTLGQKYPTEFDAIERYADKRKFYEYDPIGFISEDGTVTLFDEYKRQMEAGATDYVPSVHKTSDGKPRKLATRNNPGRSPYLNMNDESNRVNIIVSSKSVENISVKSYYKKTIFNGWELKPEGYFVYATRASIYKDPSSKTFEMLGNYGEGKELGFGATWNSIITIENNKSIMSEKSTKYAISDINKAKFNIDIDTKFIKYNWSSGFPDYAGTVTHISQYDNSLLTLSYDGATKTVKLNSKKDKVVSCTPDSFTLNRGETKDIVVKYQDNNDNRTEEWTVTYSIGIE